MAEGYFSFTVKQLEYENWCRFAAELWHRFLEASFELERRRSPQLARHQFEAKVAWEVVHSPLPFSRYICDFLDFVSGEWMVELDWEWSTAIPAGASWLWCDAPATYVICAGCSDPARLSVFDTYRRTRILLHELAHVVDPLLTSLRSRASKGDWLGEASPMAEIRAWWFALVITKLIQGAYALFHRKTSGAFADDQTANTFL